MIPNTKKIIKNTGFVEKILSSPKPISAPTMIEDIKSKEIFKPILYPLLFIIICF